MIMILSGYGQEHRHQREEVAGTQGGASSLPESVGRKERSSIRHDQQVGTWATTRPCLDHPQARGCVGRGTSRTDEGRMMTRNRANGEGTVYPRKNKHGKVIGSRAGQRPIAQLPAHHDDWIAVAQPVESDRGAVPRLYPVHGISFRSCPTTGRVHLRELRRRASGSPRSGREPKPWEASCVRATLPKEASYCGWSSR